MQRTLTAVLFVAVSAGRRAWHFAEASKSKWSVDPRHLGVEYSDKRNVTGKLTVKGPISHGALDKVKSTAETLQTPAQKFAIKLQDEKESKDEVVSDGKQDEVKTELGVLQEDYIHMWSLKDIRNPFCRNCKGIIDYKMWMEEMGNVIHTKILLIILGLFLIWLLGTTARDFFVPPLFYWSERLNLGPEMAGATLLGFGNGAPDIFAATVAAQKDDLPLALSEILGSNMFTLCIIGGSMVLACHYFPHASEDQDSTPAQGYVPAGGCARLARTLIFYLLALACLAWNLFYGTQHVLKAICLPALYMVYLFSLYMGSEKSETGDLASALAVHSPSGELSGVSEGVAPPLAGLQPSKEVRSSLELVWWLVCLPTYFIRWICIPPVDRHWDPVRRILSAISPIGIFAFCVLTNVAEMQRLNFITLLGMFMLVVLASMSIYLSSTDKPELPWFYPVLPFISMISSMLWLGALAGELTSLIEAIGFYMEVPRLRLGFSTMVWGNNLGDLLTCIATVRSGQPDMAIAAVLAAPLIDDLIAFGLALTSIAASADQTLMPMCGQDCPTELKLPIVTSIAFVGVSIVLFVFIMSNLCKLPRLGAGLLAIWYVIFLWMVLFVQNVDAPEESGTTASK